MKKVILFGALCSLFASCNQNNSSNYASNYQYDQSSDAQITADVKSVLNGDEGLAPSSQNVNVSTQDGIVTLTGVVDSRDESYKVERRARNVRGVRDVNNYLTINN